MPAITFSGMASGLPPNLVDQLIEAEKIPLKSIEQKKAKQENKLKLVNELETKLLEINKTLGTLASTKGFNDIKLESGDANIVQGSVEPGKGVSGNWNIEVLELAQRAAAVTNGFPDKDRTEVGIGYFRFETPEGDKEIYIDGRNNTLEGVANAINTAGIGVRASVLNDRKSPDEPFKLMISGDAVGGDNEVKYPTLYLLDGDQDLYFDEEKEARNGRVKIDGFEFEISDNTVKDVIPGVTLDIKQASPGRTVNVSVKENREVVTGKIKSFVDAMNGVLTFIQTQNKMDEKTDTSQTLGGEGFLRSIENRFRRLVQDPMYGVLGNIKRLNEMGVSFNRQGTLTYDEEKFNSVLARDPTSVQMFFAGDGFNTGFIPAIKREISTITSGIFGPLTMRKRAIQERVKQMDDQIAAKERQLVVKEDSLRKKFANLEQTVSRLKSQGGAIAGMAGAGGGLPQG